MERGRDRCGNKCGGESVWVSGISRGGEEKREGGVENKGTCISRSRE